MYLFDYMCGYKHKYEYECAYIWKSMDMNMYLKLSKMPPKDKEKIFRQRKTRPDMSEMQQASACWKLWQRSPELWLAFGWSNDKGKHNITKLIVSN